MARATKGRKKNIYTGDAKIGWFKSNKAGKELRYRSSYELKFFQMLEDADDIVVFHSETCPLRYRDGKRHRVYIPDVIAVTNTGKIMVFEVKPRAMIGNKNVQAKAYAARRYFKEQAGDEVEIEYHFITEEHLFESNKSYREFLKGLQ